MNQIRFDAACGLVLVLLMPCGCVKENRPKDLPVLRPVTLTITQEGKPLGEALVLLLPEDTNDKWTASCTTDEKGKGTMRTEGLYRGVPEGKYKVAVSKISFDFSRYVGPLPNDPLERGSKQKELEETPYDAYRLVEPKYDDAATTPLTLKVMQNGAKETFDVGQPIHERIRVKIETPQQPE